MSIQRPEIPRNFRRSVRQDSGLSRKKSGWMVHLMLVVGFSVFFAVVICRPCCNRVIANGCVYDWKELYLLADAEIT